MVPVTERKTAAKKSAARKSEGHRTAPASATVSGSVTAAVSASASATVVGVGNVGTALAWALHQSGTRVEELVVHRAASAEQRRLALEIGARLVLFADWRAFGSSNSRVVWLCVPDDALAATAQQIADTQQVADRSRGRKKNATAGPQNSETIFLLTSGARSYRELAPLQRCGKAISIGGAHPFRSFPRPERTDLAGAYFAIEGDRAAQLSATRMVKRMGGVPFVLKAKDKALYHAFGVFASPLLVALLAAGAEVGERAGVPAEIVPQMLASLAGGTFANWRTSGAARSFSGPIARGDIETVRLHLTSLAAMPSLEKVYRALSEYAAARLPARHRTQLTDVLMHLPATASSQAGLA